MLAEDRSRLQKIDELYDLRLDQYLSLPQLVIVGDQSSGKTSVLEGLTGIPFPRDSGLCTRFPTQIVFKRSQITSTEARIIPAHGQEESKVDAIAKFGKIQVKSLDQKTFSEILKKGQASDSDIESFSNNILKIELSGPQYEHFSIINLPNLFKKPIAGRTTKEDMALVKKMVGQYLQNPRCIILAVVPANVDIATQEIIQMAEDVDQKGQRTLGVLTKPDLADRGAEDKIIELIENLQSKVRFELGYSIVCNWSQSDIALTIEERNEKEILFFNKSPWSFLPDERVGIKALKSRLDNLLVEVTRRHFHGVILDIRERIENLKKKLVLVGPARQTAQEQRSHLIMIASKFHGIATKAVDAYYGRDECFEANEIFRLATLIMEMNQSFSKTIHEKGFRRPFVRAQIQVDEVSNGSAKAIDDLTPTDNPVSSDSVVSLSPGFKLGEYLELEALLAKTEILPGSAEDGIMDWITNKYKKSKGFEIGTINPSLMPALFAEQSRAWGFYAQDHVTKVIRKIHDFNHAVLAYCCNDSLLCDRLWTKLVPALLPSYEMAMQQVHFLVTVERHGNLMTMNHYFAENIRKAREDRQKLQLGKLNSWSNPKGNGPSDKLHRLDDILRVTASNDDHDILDLHDTLHSYYKVARKRFVDAVCMQAIDHFLASSTASPLWVFSPHFVSKLSDDELLHIAGDDDETEKIRSLLEIELSSLEKGKSILMR